jgi:hypothetical protein
MVQKSTIKKTHKSMSTYKLPTYLLAIKDFENDYRVSFHCVLRLYNDSRYSLKSIKNKKNEQKKMREMNEREKRG